jgi:hypothetical protein
MYVLAGLLDLSENYCTCSILSIFVSHNIWESGGRRGEGERGLYFLILVYFEMFA